MKMKKIAAAAIAMALIGGTVPFAGDFTSDTEKPAIAASKVAYKDMSSVMGSFFDTSSKISVYSGSDKSKSFQMNGRTYCEGLAFSSTGSATVNVDGIQFTVGLISYTYAIDSGSVLSVYKDNKLAQKINLSSTSEPIMVGVDTKDTDVVRLVMGASGRNSLGVVDVEMSEVDPAAFTTTFAATTSELYRCCL